MRKKLGYWRSFQVHLEHGPGMPLSVVVYGEAEFARGGWRAHTHLQTVWHFDRGRAELFSLFWNIDEAIPRPSWPLDPRKRYLDPPPKRDWEPA
jgi:hypothetical protein